MKQKFSSDLIDTDFAEITRLSGLFFAPREIAIMLEFDIQDFILNCEIQGSAVYNAFYSGRLQKECDLRTKILKLADSGSSPAQTMAMDILNKSKIQIIDR